MKTILNILKIDGITKTKISLNEIEKLYRVNDYLLLVKIIIELIDSKQITPIKSAGQNGKKPVLFNTYKILKKQDDNCDIINELNFNLHPLFKLDYYYNHIDNYQNDREDILKLSEFLKERRHLLDKKISLNERSFQIWQREKYLKSGGGKKLLNNLGLDMEFLNIYGTSEPIAYYSHHKNTPQNILILENEDTFYSFREYLLNHQGTIIGMPIGTLIYGRGKGIVKSLDDFEYSVEPYLVDKKNTILYFGDLDYEGIIIYESLYKKFCKKYSVAPFIEGYVKMLEESKYLDLPKTKDGQNKNIDKIFLQNFAEDEQKTMLSILSSGLYIPQEILNVTNLNKV